MRRAGFRYRILSALKSLLAFGHRIGYLPFDVGGALRLPGVRNRLTERILPEAEIHRMLSLEPKERNRVLLTLLYASAVRVSELCSLYWRDAQANGDGGQITVFGKGDQTRSIQLPASVWKNLEKLRGDAGDDQPLFPSRKRGGSLKPLGVLRIVRQAAVRAGIDLAVSHAAFSAGPTPPMPSTTAGLPIHLVQATLGHASIITTGRYLHARPKDSSGRFLAL
jgi:integrase/recombinase XerD